MVSVCKIRQNSNSNKYLSFQNSIMKRILSLAIVALSIPAFSQTLSNIEGVEYDPTNQIFLVGNGSNVVRMHSDAVPQGALGVAQADYGLEVMGNNLYTIVGTSVKCYDVTSGSLQWSMPIAGSTFLNGMASDGVNRVWVTDFSAKKLYELDVTDPVNPSYSTVVANTTTTPNGITYDAANNRLVMVSWGANAPIKAIDLTTYALSVLTTTSIGNCDGIDHDAYGNYYVSSWSPNAITKFSNDFTTSQTITVSGGVSSAADLCYAEEIDTLAIPCTGNNVVKFLGFAPAFVGEVSSSEFQVSGYPTQVTDEFNVNFSLSQPQYVRMELYDATGKKVEDIYSGTLPQGEHRYLLTSLPSASGMYFVRVWAGMQLGVTPFIK